MLLRLRRHCLYAWPLLLRHCLYAWPTPRTRLRGLDRGLDTPSRRFDVLDDAHPTHGSPWRVNGDRMSASIVNRGMQANAECATHALELASSELASSEVRRGRQANRVRSPVRARSGTLPVYSRSLAGTILSATANQMTCGFPFDMGTLGKESPPGCGNGGVVEWCPFGGDPDSTCAYSADRLADLIRARNEVRRRGYKPWNKFFDNGKFYNELVFSPWVYSANLPRSIEAVFYMDPGDCSDVAIDYGEHRACTEYAIAAHANMLAHFGLTDRELPLLRLNIWDHEYPFSDV
jgi:hypothetical protein